MRRSEYSGMIWQNRPDDGFQLADFDRNRVRVGFRPDLLALDDPELVGIGRGGQCRDPAHALDRVAECDGEVAMAEIAAEEECRKAIPVAGSAHRMALRLGLPEPAVIQCQGGD